MNNLLNNKWITVIITKLQVALVELDVSSQSSSTCRASRASRASRARRVERVELCCSTSSTQPKCMGSKRRMCRVESSRVESSQVEFEPWTAALDCGLDYIPALYVTHSVATLAVCGLWSYVSVLPSPICLCSVCYLMVYFASKLTWWWWLVVRTAGGAAEQQFSAGSDSEMSRSLSRVETSRLSQV